MLTPRQIAARLNEMDADGACPACKSTDRWLPETSTYGLLVLNQAGVATGETLPIVALACTYCGFLRLHAIGQFSGTYEFEA